VSVGRDDDATAGAVLTKWGCEHREDHTRRYIMPSRRMRNGIDIPVGRKVYDARIATKGTPMRCYGHETSTGDPETKTAVGDVGG